MTKIKNIETGEIVEISLTDPKSSCDWSADCIGNTGNDLGYPADDDDTDDDECDYTGTTEQIKWWVDYIDAYQAADNKYYAALQNVEYDHDPNDPSDPIRQINDALGDVEFNDFPAALTAAAEEIEKFNTAFDAN